MVYGVIFFFFQAEDGIRDLIVTGVQTCALPICFGVRPSVHTRLGLNPSLGLASALQNGFRWREKIINLEGVPNLDILPAGPSSRRAADFIGPGLPAILEQAGLEYDLIFIDAPPLLGFPEPLQM